VQKNILLTGRPRVGKSTLICRVVENLKHLGHNEIGGFYTLDVRRNNERIGFSINTLDGRRGRLAEVGLVSRYRLGKYGIDMASFENVALNALEEAITRKQLVVIDEIGFMELKSQRFQQLVTRALDSSSPVLATIMRKAFYFADDIKKRNDVQLITMRVDNRDTLVSEITAMLRPLLAA
jgi:nucleoside-triphosphatase THEP1